MNLADEILKKEYDVTDKTIKIIEESEKRLKNTFEEIDKITQ